MNKILIALSIILLASCNPEKRIQKNLDRFNRVGKLWLKMNPCSNDSNTIYLPGKKDSIFFEVPIYIDDTSGQQIFIDSVTNSISKKEKVCSLKIAEAYKLGYQKGKSDLMGKLSKIKVPLPVIDTLKITLKDRLELKIIKADLDTARIQLASSQAELEKHKGKSTKWLLLFIIACLLLAVSIYFNIKRK